MEEGEVKGYLLASLVDGVRWFAMDLLSWGLRRGR